MLNMRLILLLLITLQPASLVGLTAHAQMAGSHPPACCDVACCAPGTCECEMAPAPQPEPAIPAAERDTLRWLGFIERVRPVVLDASEPQDAYRSDALSTRLPLAVSERLSFLCLWLT